MTDQSNAKTPTSTSADASKLKAELDADVQHYKKYARRNYGAAYVFTTLAVLASIGSTILVASGAAASYKSWIAILTSVPAIVLLVNSTFRFEAKSSWHWRKTRAIRALWRQLTYEGKPTAEVSAQYSKVDMELDEDWVSFGKVTNSKGS